jgi:uncharacterized membrane protein
VSVIGRAHHEGGMMTLATEQARRYGGPASDRRVGNYRSTQTFSRRATDRTELGTESAERRARALGWFSIGLGLAEIAAPRTVARLIGVNDDDDDARNTLLAFGLREITSGIGILARPRSAGWVWSRVAGDVIDLAALGKALGSNDTDRTRATAATAAVLGVTALDILTGQQLSKTGGNGAERGGQVTFREGRQRTSGVEVTQAITINRPRNEVYSFWRNFENLPRFMSHLESVEVADERRSCWKAKAPAGMTVEWEAEMLEDRPNELISWRSLPNSEVPNSGKVQFRDAPGNRGTELLVELRYQPPGGKLGALVAKLFGEEPNQQVKSDLRRLKQVLEIGEVVHSDASIHPGPHPAQPSETVENGSKGG